MYHENCFCVSIETNLTRQLRLVSGPQSPSKHGVHRARRSLSMHKDGQVAFLLLVSIFRRASCHPLGWNMSLLYNCHSTSVRAVLEVLRSFWSIFRQKIARFPRRFHVAQECLGAGDGVGAAQAVLKFSAKQSCVGKEEQEAFCRDMDTVFRERCRGYHTVRLSPSAGQG